jgi:hypothetical protein
MLLFGELLCWHWHLLHVAVSSLLGCKLLFDVLDALHLTQEVLHATRRCAVSSPLLTVHYQIVVLVYVCVNMQYSTL